MSFFETATSSISAVVCRTTTKSAENGDKDDLPNIDASVWIFGKEYNAIDDREELKKVIRSRLWITYRHDFAEIGDSMFTSDRGWGCMIRCGQMVLAETLMRMHLGRDWIWEGPCRDEKYLKILKQFEDSKDARFGIHNIALMREMKKSQDPVGTWLGPNAVSQALRILCSSDVELSLNIHVCMDHIMVIEEIKESCKKSGNGWTPLLLFLTLRLGLSVMHPYYCSDLKEIFEVPQNVGVIGGKPNHALYFIGAVDDELIYLDPHTSQPSGQIGQNVSPDENVIEASYHSEKACRIAISDLDPSLSLCFYCQDEAEFDEMCEKLIQRVVLGHDHPLFEICREKPFTIYQPSSPKTIRLESDDDNSEGEYELI